MEKKAPICKVVRIGDVEEIRSKLPSDGKIAELAEFLEAFSDFSRIKILLALQQHELCPCDLSAITGLSVSAVAHQLRILRDKKLVKYRREGKNVYYSLSDEHVSAILKIAFEHVNEKG